MRLAYLVTAALLAIPATAADGAPALAKTAAPLAEARQLAVVITDGWDATRGRLQRFERADARADWRSVAPPVPVVVGRTGLAWGVGLHEGTAATDGDPVKREGDGKAPAGVFRLSGTFGYRAAAEVPWVRMPYLHSTQAWKCVDDTASRHYNRLVDETVVEKDWESKEEMLRPDHLYRLGVVVDHNWAAQTRPGAGSCIFLHVWRGPDQPTVGCTAMAESNLEQVVRWLDPARDPALVQLPRAEYRRLRRAWRLP